MVGSTDNPLPPGSKRFTEYAPKRTQFERRFFFAKWCAQRRWERAPSGKTWDEVFTKKEGMTLDEFRRQVNEMRERKSKGS